MKYSLSLLFIALFLGGLMACNPASTGHKKVALPACGEQTQRQIQYQLTEADETLFALQAWLLWVSEEDFNIEPTHYDESYLLLLQRFHQEKHRELKRRHRLAYLQYRQQDSLLMANGYALMNRAFYAQQPMPAQGSEATLPEPALIAEFYQAKNLGDFWRDHLKSRIQSYADLYRSAASDGFQRAACFLGMVPDQPVKVSFSPFYAFGVKGQTFRSLKPEAYAIHLFLDLANTNQSTVEEVAAHEMTHVLMNEALMPYQEGFQTRLDALSAQLNVPQIKHVPVQELFARAVGQIKHVEKSDAFLASAVLDFYNPIVLTLQAQTESFENTDQNFAAYLPEFLEQFSVAETAQAWRVIEAAD